MLCQCMCVMLLQSPPSFQLSYGGEPAKVERVSDEFVVAGYLPEYRLSSWSADRAGPLTDLIYFGIAAPEDGRLPAPPIKEAVQNKLLSIKRSTHCRLLLCVGGWKRSRGFPAMAGDDSRRQRFVQELLQFCRDAGFDGVDYDWEHPDGADQRAAYGKLLDETKRAFAPFGLLVTVALPGWLDIGEQAYKAVDRVHLMSYDHDYPHATLRQAEREVRQLLQWGCPASKLVLGIPFYGRNAKREARTYAELVRGRTLDPKFDELDGFAFNGRQTVGSKVRLAKAQHLAGVMIWELGQDTSDPATSLLSAIEHEAVAAE